jgi:hypothetical protein
MEWARILAYITGTVDQELLLRNEYLAAENRILRGQLKGRLKLSDAERAKLGEIGLVAIGGLFCLALALRGPLRGVEQGTASFGIIAVTLIGSAALIGVGSLVTHLLKRRLPGILIGVHATLAVGGFAILAAYVLVG